MARAAASRRVLFTDILLVVADCLVSCVFGFYGIHWAVRLTHVWFTPCARIAACGFGAAWICQVAQTESEFQKKAEGVLRGVVGAGLIYIGIVVFHNMEILKIPAFASFHLCHWPFLSDAARASIDAVFSSSACLVPAVEEGQAGPRIKMTSMELFFLAQTVRTVVCSIFRGAMASTLFVPRRMALMNLPPKEEAEVCLRRIVHRLNEPQTAVDDHEEEEDEGEEGHHDVNNNNRKEEKSISETLRQDFFAQCRRRALVTDTAPLSVGRQVMFEEIFVSIVEGCIVAATFCSFTSQQQISGEEAVLNTTSNFNNQEGNGSSSGTDEVVVAGAASPTTTTTPMMMVSMSVTAGIVFRFGFRTLTAVVDFMQAQWY